MNGRIEKGMTIIEYVLLSHDRCTKTRDANMLEMKLNAISQLFWVIYWKFE